MQLGLGAICALLCVATSSLIPRELGERQNPADESNNNNLRADDAVDVCQGKRINNCIAWGAECCRNKNCHDYRGTKSTTASGHKCQRWDVNSPHTNNWREQMQSQGMYLGAENYCRNPDYRKYNDTWCYTEETEPRWEKCCIPQCNGACATLNTDCSNRYCQGQLQCVERDGALKCTKKSAPQANRG